MQIVQPRDWAAIAEEQITVTTVQYLTAASIKGANSALIIPETNAVRWSALSAPTASAGMPLAVGESLWIRMPLDELRFVSVTGVAKINCIYFR